MFWYSNLDVLYLADDLGSTSQKSPSQPLRDPDWSRKPPALSNPWEPFEDHMFEYQLVLIGR